LGGRASDTLSTYFAFLKGYPIDKETNEMLKLLLQELGIESGLLLHEVLYLLSIPFSYNLSKGLEKLANKLIGKSVEVWKDFYSFFLYGGSIYSFFASANNSLIILNQLYVPAEYKGYVFPLIFIALAAPYAKRIYKKLRNQNKI
jgi:hypothetical protein